MKRLMYFLVILIAFSNCEKSGKGDPPDNDVHNFDQQILDGYFVTAIAFDLQGNAWIGTFKQKLIKYNANETVVYNSQNSIISETSVIHAIAVDSENNIWIGSEGLIKYDGNNFSSIYGALSSAGTLLLTGKAGVQTIPFSERKACSLSSKRWMIKSGSEQVTAFISEIDREPNHR